MLGVQFSEEQQDTMINKVVFQLDRDEDGFPPISIEMLNAIQIEKERFQIKNAPFFTPNISYDDVVEAVPTNMAGQYTFVKVIEQSDFTSLSIIILDSSMDSLLMDLLRGLDCVIEYGEFGVYRILAVSVPASTDYESLRNQLQSLEDRGAISFAELALPVR